MAAVAPPVAALWRLIGEPFEFYLPTHELRAVNVAVSPRRSLHRCAPMPTRVELGGEERVLVGSTPVNVYAGWPG